MGPSSFISLPPPLLFCVTDPTSTRHLKGKPHKWTEYTRDYETEQEVVNIITRGGTGKTDLRRTVYGCQLTRSLFGDWVLVSEKGPINLILDPLLESIDPNTVHSNPRPSTCWTIDGPPTCSPSLTSRLPLKGQESRNGPTSRTDIGTHV